MFYRFDNKIMHVKSGASHNSIDSIWWRASIKPFDSCLLGAPIDCQNLFIYFQLNYKRKIWPGN